MFAMFKRTVYCCGKCLRCPGVCVFPRWNKEPGSSSGEPPPGPREGRPVRQPAVWAENHPKMAAGWQSGWVRGRWGISPTEREKKGFLGWARGCCGHEGLGERRELPSEEGVSGNFYSLLLTPYFLVVSFCFVFYSCGACFNKSWL